jgi:hypothetical protein
LRLRRLQLLGPLFAPDAGEGFSQVGFDAAGVTKGTIEYRFHAASNKAKRAATTPTVLTQDPFRMKKSVCYQ